MPRTISCDIAIVGGGLAGGLIALALAERLPDLDVRLFEAGETIGGNHIWSLFAADVADADRWLVAPLITYGWTGYDVAFPDHARTLDQGYYSIASERLDAAVRAALPSERIVTNAPALTLDATAVTLANGDRIEADGVIDARGAGDLSALDCGWQKFVGLEIDVPAGHGLTRPIVMDASVEQIDGYRFVYCLPFSDTRVFIEDTYYSDTPDLDRAVLRERILAYAAARGWRSNGGGREEHGVLPVVMGGDFDAYWRSGGADVPKAGVRAGLFHATTGYSLPDAVRLASAIAASEDLSGPALHALTHRQARRTWRRGRFFRMLDTMLFKAAEPAERWRILSRFYRLSPALIARFYAGRSTMTDKMRVLSGKPPVPVGRALRALLGRDK